MNIFSIFLSAALMTISSISSLIIIKPTSNYAAGEPFEIRVVLDVNDSNQFSRSYTAVFSCAVGAYQLSTLAFNQTYPVITPGIYGLVTLAVTATGCQTAFYTFTISPAVPHTLPPNYHFLLILSLPFILISTRMARLKLMQLPTSVAKMKPSCASVTLNAPTSTSNAWPTNLYFFIIACKKSSK